MSDNAEVKLSSKERKQLIAQISKASGIAQYALDAKMSDRNILQAVNHLEILSLTRSATNYNRYCQSQKTAEANSKFKQLVELNNSEIYKAGKWLVNALSRSGKQRKAALLEHNLVHKDDYNEAVINLTDTIKTQDDEQKNQTKRATTIIRDLEDKIDLLKDNLAAIQEYIIKHYGNDDWESILKHIRRKK